MKKRVIIPISVIAGIVIVGILAAIVLNPVVYHKSFMLGNDKMSVVLRIKEHGFYSGGLYNLRVTRNGTTIADNYFSSGYGISSEGVTIRTDAEGNIDITISSSVGKKLVTVEILGDEINFTNHLI